MPAFSSLLDGTGGTAAIEQGFNSILQGSMVLMSALDEVAKLHPFIGGAFHDPLVVIISYD